MQLRDIPPFARVGGVVFALVIVGFLLRLALASPAPASAACDGLPMDVINPCLARARACSGTEAEARACVQKAVLDSTPK
jgi:hypothetical protein